MSLRHWLERGLNQLWYHNSPWSWPLLPVSLLYCSTAVVRRRLYVSGLLRSDRLPVPVVVVGNLSVGGTGKTPLVIWLADFLRQQTDYRIGLLSSGYRSEQAEESVMVRADSDPLIVGDEAVLLAQKTALPVCAGRNRLAAGRRLLQQGCNLILCDDGLQHYRLQRDIEIAVVDAQREVGNGHCLPAGPLREPRSRLASIDLTIYHSTTPDSRLSIRSSCRRAWSLANHRLVKSLADFRGQTVYAVAGIAHPGNFFNSLREAGLTVLERPFPDHHRYRSEDLFFAGEKPVLMTEKDAVKCRLFSPANSWAVPLETEVASDVEAAVLGLLTNMPTKRLFKHG